LAAGPTGERCDASSDCADGGTGPVCSNSFTQNVTGVPAQIFPAPVCILPLPDGGGGNCDPAPLDSDPDGLKVHYCDGPDDPSSPGVCVPFNPADPVPGMGACYPKCTFGTDGSAATGCAGGNTCAFLNYVLVTPADGGTTADGGHVAQGVGYCQGTCLTDADCAALGDGGAGYSCQKDIGFCTQDPVVRTKALGEACTKDDSDAGACNCFAGPSGNGYCSTRCIVGVVGADAGDGGDGGGGACPAGWVCDTGQPAVATFFGLADSFPVAGPTVGMVGTCAPACTLPVDAGADASSDAGQDATLSGDAAAANDASGVSDASAPGTPEGSAGDAGSDGSGEDAALSDAGTAEAGDDASTDASADANDIDAGPDADASADVDARVNVGASPNVGVDADASPGADAQSTDGECPANSTCVGGGAVGADCLPH